jgi:PilZ domain
MLPMEDEKNNRSFPRIKCHSKVHYRLRGKPDFDSGICRDISRGGLKIVSEQFIPSSTLVMLEINALNRVLHPVGRVVWSAPIAHSNRNQTGFEFVEFDNKEQDYLNEFIKMQI